MQRATYPAARVVAAKVQAHFAGHIAEAREDEKGEAAHYPDQEAVEAMVDAAFWASLRREEGYVPTISLAFLRPERATRPLLFEWALPLAPEPLTRLAPAVERPGIHLGVWRDNGELRVWGATRTIPAYCFVLEVIAPGLLVVKHRRAKDSGKFANVAVLEGDVVKVLHRDPSVIADCPALVAALLGFDSPEPAGEPLHVLTELAASMRRHSHGGALLVVPSHDAWRESILQPVRYSVSPAFSELADLMREDGAERLKRGWQDALRRAVDAIAGLTAVDGATIITEAFDVLGFGAKIGRRDGCPRVEQVRMLEPVEGAEVEIVHPAQIGGTRHLSAAQFVQDQRESVALVASQDGRFTVFAWSSCEEMVQAHRVETLLM